MLNVLLDRDTYRTQLQARPSHIRSEKGGESAGTAFAAQGLQKPRHIKNGLLLNQITSSSQRLARD